MVQWMIKHKCVRFTQAHTQSRCRAERLAAPLEHSGRTHELIEGERQILLGSVPTGRHTSPPALSLSPFHYFLLQYLHALIIPAVSHSLHQPPPTNTHAHAHTHAHKEWHFFYHQKPISHHHTSSSPLWYPSCSSFFLNFISPPTRNWMNVCYTSILFISKYTLYVCKLVVHRMLIKFK